MRRAASGFTLIELMITLAVLAIIVMIALPAYQDQVRRTRRNQAEAHMQQIALLQEKFRTESPNYTTDWARLGGDPAAAPLVTSVGQFYTYTVTTVAANAAASPPVRASFTITATAKGDQTADTSCTPLTLTSAGVKGPDGCWR